MSSDLPLTLLPLPGFLSAAALAEIDRALPELTFADGGATATGPAREVKRNLQATRESLLAHPEIQRHVVDAVATSPLLQTAVMPTRILPPLVSKYEPGMSYGWHTDSPLMGEVGVIRADLSLTVFLSDPASYAGGELVIHTASGHQPYKLAKGDALVYPTTRLHSVSPITSGTRLAAVTWMQCAVRSADHRELLWQLKMAIDGLAGTAAGTREHATLMQVYANLIRLWAEL